MARPLRIEFPGAVYHLTSRGDRREPIFEDETDRQAFLQVLAQAMERFDASVLAWCLMSNHYHLVVQTRQANLSLLMRHLNGVYTQTYNRRHRVVGHLFQGRFKAVLVDRDAYLLEVCRYVELNPVRAGMVAAVEEWPWSSYAAHTGRVASPSWLDTPAVLRHVAGRPLESSADAAQAALRYAELVEQGRGVSLWDTGLRQQIYLGDESFVRRMQAVAESSPAPPGNEVPLAQRVPPARPLATYFGDGGDRDASIWRAHAEGRHSMSAIAAELRLSVSRVSRIVHAQEKLRQLSQGAQDVGGRSCQWP